MKNFYLLILFTFFVSSVSNAQITGISPNQGCPGQPLQTTITSNGLFLQSSSPGGNIYSIRMVKPGSAFWVFEWSYSPEGSTQVINADTTISQFNVGANNLGVYDLEVTIGDVLTPYLNTVVYTLPGAFTVIPPDGTISGTVYHDLNANGIKDAGEPGIPNRTVKELSLWNETTDVNGDYSFDVTNGNYSVCVLPSTLPYMFVTSSPDTISATINNNNAPGIDFGLRHALTSVTPNVGFKGIPGVYQITSAYPIFQPGINANGNVTSVIFLTLPNTYTIPGSNFVTVIDSFTIQIQATIPANANTGSNLDIRVNTSGTYNGTHFLTGQFNVIDAPYYITGSMFFDQNQNKIKDFGEPGINNSKIQLTPTNSIAFSNASGDFVIGSMGGAQTLAPDLNIQGLSLFTDSTSYTLNVAGNISGKDFGFISTAPNYSIVVKDLYVFARCNTDQYVSFKVRNNSNISYDAKVWLKYNDALMNYISSLTPPTSISNDTLYWDLNNLPPYSETEFKTLFGLPGAGNTLDLSAGAVSLNGSGVLQLSDYKNKSYHVFCAWDPNDKQVTPQGIFAQNYTLMTDTLEYLIRFQNTGSDTAFNVVVLDIIDDDLNLNTFEVVGSSHSVQTELKSNGELRMAFNNIMLVDSNANEPESHGYIRYRIVPKIGLTDYSPVNNTAHIYFDFNTAVVTNTTLNTLVYVLPTGIAEIKNKNEVLVYPNPFNQSTTILFDNSGSNKFILKIFDITGKIVVPEKSTNGNMFVVDKDKLANGIYFFKLTDTKTSFVRTGKLMVE